ncbi:centrosomal protein of 120 kDa-like [Watersipora subatra]|uniref:centrosomal protein of 120 kDa-like n=1 Tax=Watersipora subatra TaxID=2589382 RepID=UPI00355BBD74
MANPMQMIVVLISEGRSFPKRSSHQLIFEAKFDGELLSTDGVDHDETPEITQELAWQINRKSLQQHKLQRTPIKILCYALDCRSSAKELIGYIVIDIRSAPNKPVKRWHHLLNTKYKKSKPELKVAVYIETLTASLLADASGLSEQKINTSEVDVSQLKPQLDDVNGVFQLGPDDRCTEIFVLSVTVAFAHNLADLMPNSRDISIDPQGFYFFYTLFDNDVLTEKFLDLLDPKITAERASIRVRTSLPVIKQYLLSSEPLQFHLCSGDKSLGGASVSLESLFHGTDSQLAKSAVIEGAFELLAPSKYKDPAADVHNEKPVIGLSIQLRREMPLVLANQVDSGMCLTDRPNSTEPGKKETRGKLSPPRDTSEDYSDTFNSEEPSSKLSPSVKKSPLVLTSPSKEGRAKDPPSLTTTTEHTELSTQPHHFEFTLQLTSIRNVLTDHHIFVYLRYRYPGFGSVAPFTTHPAIEVRRGSEQTLSNSLCTMDFSMSLGDLKLMLSQQEFEIELWQYDQMSGNRLLGKAVLPVLHLFSVKPQTITLHDKRANQFSQTMSLPVYATNSQIAELCARCSLCDFGEVPAQLVVQQETAAEKRVDSPLLNPKKSLEYQAALELEIWKDSQEKLFEQQLREKENRLLAKLTEDFRKRDMERELLCKKKIGENTSMQQELQKMVNQMSKRENSIAKKEQELQRVEADLKHTYDRKLLDLKESSRRLEEECEHKLHLSRAKVNDCEQQVLRLKQELDEAARKYKELEKEYGAFKEQQANRPEIKLQSEINLLTLEKVELERKLEATNKSKAHYKQQWGRALKENAKLKETSDAEAKRYAQKQIQELEIMKQRLFATEEREIVKSERRELADIREEINRQQKAHTALEKAEKVSEPEMSKVNPAVEEQLKRLQDERDSLLKTGVFNTEDDMILELERQIRALIQSIDNQ